MLRLDNLLGASAMAMDCPCNDNGGFRNSKLHIMILTDLAVRGLDIPNISHIINLTYQSMAMEGKMLTCTGVDAQAGWAGGAR